MPAFTVGYRPIATVEQQHALADLARTHGSALSWTHTQAAERSYALVEGPLESIAARAAIGVENGVTVFDAPVIALAIRPNVAEALPALHDALGGAGRPAGVGGAEIAGDRCIVEWNMDVSAASLVIGVVDVELARFGASRVTELLTPLPLAWWTAIARDGLAAPEIAPDRVLEALIEEHHVAS